MVFAKKNNNKRGLKPVLGFMIDHSDPELFHSLPLTFKWLFNASLSNFGILVYIVLYKQYW